MGKRGGWMLLSPRRDDSCLDEGTGELGRSEILFGK